MGKKFWRSGVGEGFGLSARNNAFLVRDPLGACQPPFNTDIPQAEIYRRGEGPSQHATAAAGATRAPPPLPHTQSIAAQDASLSRRPHRSGAARRIAPNAARQPVLHRTTHRAQVASAQSPRVSRRARAAARPAAKIGTVPRQIPTGSGLTWAAPPVQVCALSRSPMARRDLSPCRAPANLSEIRYRGLRPQQRPLRLGLALVRAAGPVQRRGRTAVRRQPRQLEAGASQPRQGPPAAPKSESPCRSRLPAPPGPAGDGAAFELPCPR